MYMRKKLRDDVSNIPPFYGGTTFEKHLGSDGREEYSYKGLMPVEKPPLTSDNIPSEVNNTNETEDETENRTVSAENDGINDELHDKSIDKKENSFSELFSRFGNDDLLIIALIIILASEKGESREVILLLLFLLVAGKQIEKTDSVK